MRSLLVAAILVAWPITASADPWLKEPYAWCSVHPRDPKEGPPFPLLKVETEGGAVITSLVIGKTVVKPTKAPEPGFRFALDAKLCQAGTVDIQFDGKDKAGKAVTATKKVKIEIVH